MKLKSAVYASNALKFLEKDHHSSILKIEWQIYIKESLVWIVYNTYGCVFFHYREDI